jgi:hypothetical protein
MARLPWGYCATHTLDDPLHPLAQRAPLPSNVTHVGSSVHVMVQVFSIDEHPLLMTTDCVRQLVPVAHLGAATLHDFPGPIRPSSL